MWLSAEERHKDYQALYKQRMHDYNPWEECKIRVVLMVHICKHSLNAK
jgi:hypothetical protein